MDNVYVYLVRFPCGTVHEAVMPCADGYTVYIDDRLSYEQQKEAYAHAINHIHDHDFDKLDVNEIETQAHKKQNAPTAKERSA